jgi:protein-disulfide isomerase
MASRTKQKEEARARRLAEEQAASEKARRTRRLQMLGGVVIVAIAVVAVAIAVSSGGSSSNNANIASTQKPCTGSDAAICTLLNGIPQSGNTLGNPHAPVTVTEYGDLQCPICADFATGGIQNQLIQNEIRQGKVKMVYRSLMTATGNSPDPSIFGVQQASAGAAGLQKKAWYYIELFYHHQGAEGSGYVNQTFLNNLAKRVLGLDFNKWLSDSHSQPMLSQVSADQAAATAKGFNSTPTLLIDGPKGQTQPIVGVPNSYADLQKAINSVS